MAQGMNLLDSEIHEVQEVWTGWRGLRAANHATQTSPRGIQFFHVVSPNELPDIMGLRGVHSQKPYISKAVGPSAPSVERRGRMKAWL